MNFKSMLIVLSHIIVFFCGVFALHYDIISLALLRKNVYALKSLLHDKDWASKSLNIDIDIKKLDVQLNETLNRSVELRHIISDRVLLPSDIMRVEKKWGADSTFNITTKFYGIETRSVFAKKDSATCLIVYIQGHGGNPFDFSYHNTIRSESISKGCDFISMSMLGMGLNKNDVHFPRYDITVYLPLQFAQNHLYYSYYKDSNYPNHDPISLFLSGHYHTIASLIKDYEKVSILGISGGGWYSSWLSALIPEIDQTISYAGSLPLEYQLSIDQTRGNILDPGDWEQTISSVYHNIDYWDLYLLSTIDKQGRQSRRSHLVFNDRDSCCFRDPYASHFKSIVDSLSVSMPQIIIDKNDQHTMNPSLVNSILH